MVVVEAKALAVSKVNNSRTNSNKVRIRYIFCEKKGHEEDNYQRKHPKKRSTRFKNQNSSSDESIPKGKRKKKKLFGATAFVQSLMSMVFTINITKSQRYHNAQLLDSRTSVHMYNFQPTFTDQRVLKSPIDIQSIGKPV